MTAKTYKLAELLLRRKELQDCLARLAPMEAKDVFDIRIERKSVSEGYEEVLAAVPQISINQVTAYHRWLAAQLRITDGLIQQANWTTEVEAVESLDMGEYIDKFSDDGEHNKVRLQVKSKGMTDARPSRY